MRNLKPLTAATSFGIAVAGSAQIARAAQAAKPNEVSAAAAAAIKDMKVHQECILSGGCVYDPIVDAG
jgi:hypothetical protein